jgi:hypothetical protein
VRRVVILLSGAASSGSYLDVRTEIAAVCQQRPKSMVNRLASKVPVIRVRMALRVAVCEAWSKLSNWPVARSDDHFFK